MTAKTKKGIKPAPLNIKKAKMTEGKALPKAKASKKTEAPKTKVVIKKKKSYLTTLTEKRPRNYGIGMDIQPKKNMSRFLRWPKYVRIQRQEQILRKRMKIPPSLNQFKMALNRNLTINLFSLLHKYRPESKEAKKARLLKIASIMAEQKKTAKKAGKKEAAPAKKASTKEKSKTDAVKSKTDATKSKSGAAKSKTPVAAQQKPILAVKEKKSRRFLVKGIKEVTSLVEKKKAKLVVIAHDVDPIELIVWLPALCRKMDVPYCIIKGKSRLGKLVHRKTVTCLCLKDVKPKDKVAFTKLVGCIRSNFNDNLDEIKRTWGGGIRNRKSLMTKKEKSQSRSENFKVIEQ